MHSAASDSCPSASHLSAWLASTGLARDAAFKAVPARARARESLPRLLMPPPVLRGAAPGAHRARDARQDDVASTADAGVPPAPPHACRRPLDCIVPHEMRMGRIPYADLNGVLRHPTGRVSETETVWTSMQVLCAAEQAPVPAGGDRPASAWLDIVIEPVGNPIFPFPIEHLAFLDRHNKEGVQAVRKELAVLDGSPTFRKLLRLAVQQGRLGPDDAHRRTMRVVPPIGFRGGFSVFAGPFIPDPGRRDFTVPSCDSPPIAGRYYIYNGGSASLMGPSCTIVEVLVRLLTGLAPSRHTAWLDAKGNVDPSRIQALGAAERGAVDYLAQRIYRELFKEACPWLTPLPFGDGSVVVPPGAQPGMALLNDETRRAFDAIGGIDALALYVRWQDDYLEAQYPSGQAA